MFFVVVRHKIFFEYEFVIHGVHDSRGANNPAMQDRESTLPPDASPGAPEGQFALRCVAAGPLRHAQGIVERFFRGANWSFSLFRSLLGAGGSAPFFRRVQLCNSFEWFVFGNQA